MPESAVKPQLLLDEERLPPVLGSGPDLLPRYAELHCLSNFSFQRGASHPQELVRRAYDLGYDALAITDECSVAGVVRAGSGLHDYLDFIRRLEEAYPGQRRLRPFRLLYGSEFDFGDGRLVAIARDLPGWGGLCEFITAARTTRAPKGTYVVGWETSDLRRLQGCEILFAPQRPEGQRLDIDALCRRLHALRALYGDSLWLAVNLPHRLDDDLWLADLREAGERTGVPLVATGDVHMHARSRKPLQDVITAVRLGRPVAGCGLALQGNAERHLRQRKRLAELYPRELLDRTLQLADRCRFELDEIRYDYPLETVPPGLTPTQALRQLTYEGARERYPQGLPPRVVELLEKELPLIEQCRYEMFFLTVHDIVRFARSENILCQGRGSAANSVVCFCLGITAMDPMLSQPLLERFISVDRRNEPPDIDVDFEHERREEVIQYIYGKYGRERAAIAAVVIGYRTRSAIRDVGKALGVAEPLVDAFAKDHFWFDDRLAPERLREMAAHGGVPLAEHQARLWLELAQQLIGFPRHLSQHVGGFVLTQTKLTRLVPVENASMKERSVIQWDKDDLEDMGLMKVDVLALGMLSAIRRCIDLVAQRRGAPFTRYDIPTHDEPTYEMIRRADTVGVFQIESRAQMSMLPRLKPREFYDLVVQVAIVRPGPITGGMVHPYLKARERKARGEAIEYERSTRDGAEPRLKKALERTLGIPIFQEQVMEISMLAAGFTATEADALRRAMAAWKRKGGLGKFEARLKGGMLANGYSAGFADRIFEQIKGFGDYGFPESHAYSFALLAWSSSWLKCHEPACFLAAMLNSQPMGFYAPSQLVQDAQRHGVKVLPPDVSASDWDSRLEWEEGGGSPPQAAAAPAADTGAPPAVRLGLRLVGGLREEAAQRIAQARAQGAFIDTEDLALRARLDVQDLAALAAGDALQSLAGHRRQQVWEASAQRRAPELLQHAPIREAALALPAAHEGEEIVFDYDSLGLTLRRHPVALLRPKLARMRFKDAQQLQALPDGCRVSACGMVTVRQQPSTANGTIFVTLEDETGPVNVIVWKGVREQQREPLMHARLLAVHGTWQRDEASQGRVCHLIAERLEDLTPLLGRLGRQSRSRDFR
ncbi:error-prone DNA polymerase [Ramlibacter tataouinensis]|uniref:error-prone DNA polymerase n=1 Tax=Ramlibacter tataouinensis TaxID=94132 RepID=UPI0022F3AE31|nr:error-prone DNA polymerase [Ramlibacter tataouinensis]WBY01506.1 error-prone DNA polymerase [Ramlibacter tataouinensis]